VGDVLTPCREWQGYRDHNGYGVIARGPVRDYGKGPARTPMRLHRWVWEQVYGPIPDGMVIMHMCDNPPCFRLDHLMLGTNADNQADKITKGRAGSRSPYTTAEIEYIRSRLAAGELGKDLAVEYGVCDSTITNYRYGRTKGRWVT
jgi:HNH endonuclease